MRLLSFIFLALLLAESVYASEFLSHTIQRDEYSPGETALIWLELKQQPEKMLTPLNVALRDAGERNVRISPFLVRTHDNKYMIFFDIPQSALDGAYEAVIKDALFKEAGTLQRIEYAIPFTIKKHSPTLSIFPAAVVLERKKAFTIRVYTLEQTVLTIEGSNGVNNVYTTEQPLLPRTERIFKMSVSDIAGPEESMQLHYGNYTYTIPVLIRRETSEEQNVTQNQPESVTFLTDLLSIEREIVPDQVVEGSIEINNSGNSPVPLRVAIDPSLASVITIEAPASIGPGERVSVLVTINQNRLPNKEFYEGDLTITAGHTSKTLPVKITILQGSEEPPIIPHQRERNESAGEVVTPPLFEVNLTQPESAEQRSVAGIFVFLFVLLLIALVVYALSRRTTKKKSFDEYIQEIQKK